MTIMKYIARNPWILTTTIKIKCTTSGITGPPTGQITTPQDQPKKWKKGTHLGKNWLAYMGRAWNHMIHRGLAGDFVWMMVKVVVVTFWKTAIIGSILYSYRKCRVVLLVSKKRQKFVCIINYNTINCIHLTVIFKCHCEALSFLNMLVKGPPSAHQVRNSSKMHCGYATDNLD